jgi:hypothetical protein
MDALAMQICADRWMPVDYTLVQYATYERLANVWRYPKQQRNFASTGAF